MNNNSSGEIESRTTSVDAERLEAWRAFLAAHAVLTDVLEAELLAERGLPLAWYDVLFQLSLAPGGERRMQELAGAVLLSKSGLTRLVARMEQAGLVERRPCPTDLRGTIAALTPSGKAALRRARPIHLRGIREHFADRLSDEEARALCSAFGRVLAARRSTDRECQPALGPDED
ncbi:MAG TPA: MarR family transcriptional regulator [Dehalococcoidia bacterium]|nr:MarR family transcriptional regulator [Dehalococcoidia bacterium]